MIRTLSDEKFTGELVKLSEIETRMKISLYMYRIFNILMLDMGFILQDF